MCSITCSFFVVSYLSACYYVYTLYPLSSILFFFLMIRRPPRSTLDRSSAASDVYKRQVARRPGPGDKKKGEAETRGRRRPRSRPPPCRPGGEFGCCSPRFSGHRARPSGGDWTRNAPRTESVSYTHLRAHETVLDLVCRLLLEKKTI